jgi:hypothetical protein
VEPLAIANPDRLGLDIMGAGRISDLHAIEYQLNDAALIAALGDQ